MKSTTVASWQVSTLSHKNCGFTLANGKHYTHMYHHKPWKPDMTCAFEKSKMIELIHNKVSQVRCPSSAEPGTQWGQHHQPPGTRGTPWLKAQMTMAAITQRTVNNLEPRNVEAKDGQLWQCHDMHMSLSMHEKQFNITQVSLKPTDITESGFTTKLPDAPRK